MGLDRSTVEAVVQHYFDAVYEGDADKLGEVFHPSADLRSLENGELQVLTCRLAELDEEAAVRQSRRQAARGFRRHDRPLR